VLPSEAQKNNQFNKANSKLLWNFTTYFNKCTPF